MSQEEYKEKNRMEQKAGVSLDMAVERTGVDWLAAEVRKRGQGGGLLGDCHAI